MSDAAQLLEALAQNELGLPEGLELEWLGVSGYRMSYQGSTIFIDPYVSRVRLREVLLRRAARPDAAAIDRYIVPGGEVAGVLVGHTHFDHAVDAPEIARRHGCRAYGSQSLQRLMQLHGLFDLAVVVEPHTTYEIGPFVVRFVPSTHSKLILGRKVLWDGELTCEQLDALHPGAYRCGHVFGIRIEVAGVSFYHQGSADLIDDELPGEPVDYFLAGVAGRHVTPRFWRRILPKLDPRVIVPTHYDNFFKPLGEEQSLVAKVKLEELPDEIAEVSGDARLAALRRVDERPGG